MTFYDLKKLNIKLSDFICLLSPLGVVNKIVSNGNKNLVEIEFHKHLLINDGIQLTEDNFIDNSLIKLYQDSNYGFIINNNIGILELPYGIKDNDVYIQNLNEKNSKNISKYIRKNIPKDCFKILSKGIKIPDRKLTDPNKININNMPGYKSIIV